MGHCERVSDLPETLWLMNAEIERLRRQIARRFPDAAVRPGVDAAGTVSSGIPELDERLPGGGFPLGRISQWTGGGAHAGIGRMVAHVLRVGHVAWIDGDRSLANELLRTGLVVLRPESTSTALAIAETTATAGCFRLVVLSGVRPTRAQAVRLSRAAQSGRSALLITSTVPVGAGVRLHSAVRPGGERTARESFATLDIQFTTGGDARNLLLPLVLRDHEVRLSLVPYLADRRGHA